MVEEKEEVQKGIEEKEEKTEKEWWKTIPTWVMVLAIFIFFIALRGVTLEEGGMSQVLILMGVVAVLVLLSKKYKAAEGILSPKEAELYAERDLYRKQMWGQFSPMSKLEITPVNNPQRRDAAGIYYGIGVIERNPFKRTKYWLAKVPMRGDEKSFVGLQESIIPITGRELVPERTLFGITKKLREDPFFKEGLLSRR